MAHTPNQWVWSKVGTRPDQIIIGAPRDGVGPGIHVASIPIRKEGITQEDIDNARLIVAAAPLLFACQDALRFVNHFVDYAVHPDPAREVYTRMRTAMAKAGY